MTGNTWIALGVIALAFSAIAIPYGFHLKSNQQPQIKQETAGERSPNVIIEASSSNISINQKSSGTKSPNIVSGKEGASVKVVYDDVPRKNNRDQQENK
jgi:hypothetical protein